MPGPARPQFDPDESLSAEQRAFLSAVAIVKGIQVAGQMSGINRRRHSEWMREPLYAEEYARALEFFGQRLVQEAVRRAYEGEYELVLDKNSRPVFVWVDPSGQVVRENTGNCSEIALWKCKKDSSLLMFLIKQMDPSYRDNAKVIFLSDDLSSLSDEQLAKLDSQLTKAAR